MLYYEGVPTSKTPAGKHTLYAEGPESHPLPAATPAESGIGSQAILDFLDRLQAHSVCMHSFQIIRDGALVSEGYWKPFAPNRLHRLYSCSKSFVSAAIGLLEAEGKLKLTDPIAGYFPDKLPPEGIQGLHPFIAQTTIEDMLRMATPHAKTTYKQFQTDDWVKTFFLCEPSHLPGTVFSYDTSSSYTLSALVQRLSGVSLMEYLRPRVFDRIGVSKEAYALTCPMGIDHGGSGIMATPRDFAKFALTCMQEGMYQGVQVIPKDYIRRATSRQIDNRTAGSRPDSIQGYGYQFWMLRNGAFGLLGMGGQIAMCLPKERLLVVTTADVQSQPDGEQAVFSAVWDTLYPAACSPSSIAPEKEASDFARLQQRVKGLSMEPVQGSSQIPESAARISGRTFSMEKNAMGIQKLRFDFGNGIGRMSYVNGEGSHTLSFGLGGWETQQFPVYGYECVTSGAWVSNREGEENLLLRCCIIDEFLATLKVCVVFKGDTVTLVMHKFAELFLQEYEGFASGALM